MANRNYASGGKIYAMAVKPVMIMVQIPIGAAGAVGTVSGGMVQSVTHVSAGKYTIKLQAQTNFAKLMYAAGSLQAPASGNSGISQVEIQNAPDTSVKTAAAGQLTVTCLAATDATTTTLAPTDPASGSVLQVIMILNDSKVSINGM